MSAINGRRVRKSIKDRYESCRLAIAEARDCRKVGYTIGVKARLEEVNIWRNAIADARLALKLGRTVVNGESGACHRENFAGQT